MPQYPTDQQILAARRALRHYEMLLSLDQVHADPESMSALRAVARGDSAISSHVPVNVPAGVNCLIQYFGSAPYNTEPRNQRPRKNNRNPCIQCSEKHNQVFRLSFFLSFCPCLPHHVCPHQCELLPGGVYQCRNCQLQGLECKVCCRLVSNASLVLLF